MMGSGEMEKRKLLFVILTLIGLTACGSIPADAPAEIPEDIKYVALTFDDGPKRSSTSRLLDGLQERGVNVTFFLVGEQIEANKDIVIRMRDEGHQIGNHTWTHQRLENADATLVSQEVTKTEECLEALLGGGKYWLRPPSGIVPPATEKLMMVPMIKWSVDPRDWECRNTEKVVQAILQDVQPNSIILLHDIYQTSVDAAIQIIDTLEEKGYRFVTVEELLEINGIEPQAGVMYRTGNA